MSLVNSHLILWLGDFREHLFSLLLWIPTRNRNQPILQWHIEPYPNVSARLQSLTKVTSTDCYFRSEAEVVRKKADVNLIHVLSAHLWRPIITSNNLQTMVLEVIYVVRHGVSTSPFSYKNASAASRLDPFNQQSPSAQRQRKYWISCS